MQQSSSSIAPTIVTGLVTSFQYHKSVAERAVAQVTEDHLHLALDADTNSIAVVMQHIAGNLRSRWTDFLTADGEKPWRDRDAEFVDAHRSRADLLRDWEGGWACLLDALGSLREADLARTIVIRGEAMPVPVAACRSLAHTAYHVGQIVQLARHFAGDNWRILTIPRGASQAYNQQHWGRG
jgi:hypothetical protein